MSKTIQVRWNGSKEDPDQITQYDIAFPKGEWVSVPVPDKDDFSPVGKRQRLHLDKFKGNPWFEVKGFENDAEPALGPAGASNTAASALGGPVRAPNTTYSVQRKGNGKGKASSFIVVGKDGNAVAGDEEYADEESAQNVADAMNQVPAA